MIGEWRMPEPAAVLIMMVGQAAATHQSTDGMALWRAAIAAVDKTQLGHLFLQVIHGAASRATGTAGLSEMRAVMAR